MANTNVTPNYEDERFDKVESDKQQALTEHEQLYAGMIDNVDGFYNAQIEASQQWADKQTQIQNEKTDFAIEQIEQQKDKAHKDYLKEQSGAYVDWQKQSNQYGTNAEQMASAGLTNTGFSESSQVGMYNTYQNRVATAREVYSQAVLNYDNAIKDARLQNNAVLAEIAFETLQKQLELSLQGFQHKNDLLLQQANKKLEIDNAYYNRYLDVLNQINTENAMAEEIRQFNENQAWQTEQNQLNRDFEAQQAEAQRAFDAQQAEINRQYQAKEAELDRKHDLALQAAKTKAEKELLEQQHKNDMAKLEKQKQNEIALLEREHALSQASKGISGGGGTSGGGGSGGSGGGGKITSSGTVSTSSGNVNLQSVLALGYGPISGDKLASLVAQGKVEIYQKNGQLYARKKTSTSSGSAVANSKATYTTSKAASKNKYTPKATTTTTKATTTTKKAYTPNSLLLRKPWMK